jgi:hypothetical protein
VKTPEHWVKSTPERRKTILKHGVGHEKNAEEDSCEGFPLSLAGRERGKEAGNIKILPTK